jgi:anti-sigma B factor antagonist
MPRAAAPNRSSSAGVGAMTDGTARLNVQKRDSVDIVEFSDRKILEELSIREIEDELFALVAATPSIHLLLDFSNVEHLSSAALGMLINLQKEVGKQHGALKLADIRPQIYEVFKITRLSKLFEIHESVDDALAKF